MPGNLNVADIMNNLPWPLIGITAGLFIAAMVLDRVLKRHLRKTFQKKAADDTSFLVMFWRSESTLILDSISWIIWLAFIGGAMYLWSGFIGKLFTKVQSFYPPVLRSVIVMIIAIIAIKAVRVLINLIIEKISPLAESTSVRGSQRMKTLHHVFSYGSTIIIVGITVLMLLDNFNINLKAILATVGVASVAIGFGAQSLVKDVFSGIFIIIEDQFAVGDVVVANGEGGVVERMTLRITQLRNTHGMLITIPNGEIAMVKNLTSEWSRVDYTIGVAYETDLDHAMDVLMDEAGVLKKDMPNEIIEEPERIGVDAFGDSSITLRVWIKTRPLMQWKVLREFNRRIHKRFEKEGIEIPFPQRTLWIKEPKEALLAALVEKQGLGIRREKNPG
jgi:small conductance mechanosensitive channel